MNQRRLIVLGLDIALLVVATVVIVLHPWGDDGDAAGPAREAQSAADQGITSAGRRAQAREVRRALATLERDPAKLVAQASRETLGGRARQAVPAGSKVTPMEKSWSPDTTGGGTMTVKVAAPGRPAVSYGAVMVREAGGWKVLATIPLATP